MLSILLDHLSETETQTAPEYNAYIPWPKKGSFVGTHLVGKNSTIQRHDERYMRRRVRHHQERFRQAVVCAYANGWPINVALTITWSALINAGEQQGRACHG